MNRDDLVQFDLTFSLTTRQHMTDEEWLSCASAGTALETVKRMCGTGTRRLQAFRLFCCHALRLIEPLTSNPDFGPALDVAENYFCRLATVDELKAAIRYAQAGEDLSNPKRATLDLDRFLAHDPFGAAYQTASSVKQFGWRPGDPIAQARAEALAAKLAALVRELFGNPFRPVAFAAEWRSDTALSLARHIYEARDFAAMPILADALQDAGCTNADILDHCRDPQQTHVRGCWVVDLVLGKS